MQTFQPYRCHLDAGGAGVTQGVMLPKARGLSMEVPFWAHRQAAQVSLQVALKSSDALHTSDVISPC